MGIRAKRPGSTQPRANGNKGETTHGRTGFRAKRPGLLITLVKDELNRRYQSGPSYSKHR